MIDVAIAKLIKTATGLDKRQIRAAHETLNVFRDTLPAVVFTRRDAQRYGTDDGPTGLVSAAYQLDVFGTTLTDAAEVLADIRNGMDWYSGTEDETNIQLIRFGGDRFEAAQQAPGQNQTWARYIEQITVSYRE